MKKIGLIAGNRKFPILFAREARKQGFSVVAAAIKKDTSCRLRYFVDKIFWVGLGDFSRLFELFRLEGINELVMAGQISPRRLFSREVQESRVLKDLLAGIEDKKADTIFSMAAKMLEKEGFRILDSTTFLREYMPAKGTLTKNEPDAGVWEDIRFGLPLAKEVAGLDIGQTVAVKNKAIVAVEALEGTDNLIRRAGRISRAGATIIKVSKPSQDMRFDIPVIGLDTIKNIIRAKARCLAFEADKTLFIDREKAVALADGRGIAVVAV
jgi:DUF1009 family protein